MKKRLIQGSDQDCWSAYIFFNQIHYFMVKITTFSFSIISWSKSILFLPSGGWGRQAGAVDFRDHTCRIHKKG
jgi:hypothetical protein